TSGMKTDPRHVLMVPDGTPRLSPSTRSSRSASRGAATARSTRVSVSATYRFQASIVSDRGAASTVAEVAHTTSAANTHRSATMKFTTLIVATAATLAATGGRPATPT